MRFGKRAGTKKGLVTMAAFTGAISILAASPYPGRNAMEIMRIVVGPLQVNCFIVADEKAKEAIVIDPGDDAEDIIAMVKQRGLNVRYIVNTHAHFDHVAANQALKDATGAELLLHEGDAPLLARVPQNAKLFGMSAPSSPPADRYVGHGDVITAGAISLKVLHTPGHSPGGICLLGDGFVFTGDALFENSIGRSDLPGGDLMTLINAIKAHLMTLPDETQVFCGHGPATTIGAERQENPFLNAESGF